MVLTLFTHNITWWATCLCAISWTSIPSSFL